MRIEIATIENLHQVLNKNPIILHFICHGDYCKKLKKFYLAFENQYGELDKVTPDRIEPMLLKCTELKLVFVNACHSEEGKIFQ